ncbi:putative reverse transcriptase domain-containing protein [Tanacetum coccineum]|uniref:Reverse transcriptase domain-containing protein n=1 Tax=Tanacetum coccineum TaxID=301880 RepID=A0ABQ4WKU4_9ASTR
MDLMNRMCKPYLDKFVIVFIDDILIYSHNKEEHEDYLRIILELLKKEKLYAKFSKCDFWISTVQFLGHIIDSRGIHVDPTKIKAVKDWASPTTPIEYIWGENQELAFQLLKQKLREALILALSEGNNNFVVYCNASHQDRLTKSAHFIPTRETDSMETLTRLYIKEIVSRHGVPISIISDRDSHFTSRFWQSMQSALGTQLDMSMAYHPETDGQNRVMLKVSHRKGVIRFRKQGKLKSLDRIGPVAYTLELPEELSNVYSTFYVSNLKKCLSDESLIIPMKKLQLDDKLNFVIEHIEIMDREVKQLKQNRIPKVNVRWNSKRGPEFMWKCEDQICAKYPRLFSNITPTSN